ncbi:hypothetical protein [Nocardiopsis potens]|nr:hypothetical protein [Nocardiopsis potens]
MGIVLPVLALGLLVASVWGVAGPSPREVRAALSRLRERGVRR